MRGSGPSTGGGRPRERREFDRSGTGAGYRSGEARGPVRDQPRHHRPDVPEDVSPRDLDAEVREELRSLPKDLADAVARHLIMTGRLIDNDPAGAYEHARTAQRLASRVPAVREAAGLAAYTIGRYAEALAELRAARRMTGSNVHWPIMADCERGLGRPERTLAMAGAPEVRTLDAAGKVEMRIVAAGARRDLGQVDAALVTLQTPELTSPNQQPWVARLRYAYADTLLAAGREDEARTWFGRAADADPTGDTAAAERLAELEGIEFLDALDADADADADAETESDAEPEPVPDPDGGPPETEGDPEQAGGQRAEDGSARAEDGSAG